MCTCLLLVVFCLSLSGGCLYDLLLVKEGLARLLLVAYAGCWVDDQASE